MDALRVTGQDRREICEVAAVVVDLQNRVRPRGTKEPGTVDQFGVALE